MRKGYPCAFCSKAIAVEKEKWEPARMTDSPELSPKMCMRMQRCACSCTATRGEAVHSVERQKHFQTLRIDLPRLPIRDRGGGNVAQRLVDAAQRVPSVLIVGRQRDRAFGVRQSLIGMTTLVGSPRRAAVRLCPWDAFGYGAKVGVSVPVIAGRQVHPCTPEADERVVGVLPEFPTVARDRTLQLTDIGVAFARYVGVCTCRR